jgi:hypothetical protein
VGLESRAAGDEDGPCVTEDGGWPAAAGAAATLVGDANASVAAEGGDDASGYFKSTFISQFMSIRGAASVEGDDGDLGAGSTVEGEAAPFASGAGAASSGVVGCGGGEMTSVDMGSVEGEKFGESMCPLSTGFCATSGFSVGGFSVGDVGLTCDDTGLIIDNVNALAGGWLSGSASTVGLITFDAADAAADDAIFLAEAVAAPLARGGDVTTLKSNGGRRRVGLVRLGSVSGALNARKTWCARWTHVGSVSSLGLRPIRFTASFSTYVRSSPRWNTNVNEE